MMSLILIAAIAAAAYYFLVYKKQQAAQSTAVPGRDTTALTLENVQAGGMIRLLNIGPDLKEFDATVIARHVYRQGESTWYELEVDAGDAKYWIDMERDDELEVAITLKKLKLRDLNLKKADLERFDDKEEGEFKYDNDTYYYEDSDEAVFYRYGADKEAEKFYYWDFENNNGTRYIGIERWSDGSIDVSYSEPIKESQITVYRLKGA